MRERADRKVGYQPQQVVPEPVTGGERAEGGLFAAQGHREQCRDIQPAVLHRGENLHRRLTTAAFCKCPAEGDQRRANRIHRRLNRFAAQRGDPRP